MKWWVNFFVAHLTQRVIQKICLINPEKTTPFIQILLLCKILKIFCPLPTFFLQKLKKKLNFESGSRTIIMKLTINKEYNKGMLLAKATPTVQTTSMPLWPYLLSGDVDTILQKICYNRIIKNIAKNNTQSTLRILFNILYFLCFSGGRWGGGGAQWVW